MQSFKEHLQENAQVDKLEKQIDKLVDKFSYIKGDDAKAEAERDKLRKKKAELVKKIEKITGKKRVLEGLDEANASAADMAVMEKIAAAIEGKALTAMRKPLEQLFRKKDIDFTTSPLPMYQIKYKSGINIVILNKKYVNKADVEVGDYAIGILQ